MGQERGGRGSESSLDNGGGFDSNLRRGALAKKELEDSEKAAPFRGMEEETDCRGGGGRLWKRKLKKKRGRSPQ